MDRIRIGNYIYNRLGIGNEFIVCGRVERNFEGSEYIVWYK